MKKLKYIIAAFAILITINTKAQTFYTTLSYDMSFPMGETSDFIDKASFRGMSFELGWYLQDNLAFDLRFSWHTFYKQMPYDSYTDGTQTLSGVQFRYLNSFPITAGLNYYFINDGMKQLYAGAGIGAYGQYRRTEMGIYATEPKVWHFGFYPEIGFNWEFSYGVGLNIFARYDATIKSKDNPGNQYLTLGIGFNFNN